MKFGVFYDVMGKHFDRVATGHYARAVREGTSLLVLLLLLCGVCWMARIASSALFFC